MIFSYRGLQFLILRHILYYNGKGFLSIHPARTKKEVTWVKTILKSG